MSMPIPSSGRELDPRITRLDKSYYQYHITEFNFVEYNVVSLGHLTNLIND